MMSQSLTYDIVCDDSASPIQHCLAANLGGGGGGGGGSGGVGCGLPAVTPPAARRKVSFADGGAADQLASSISPFLPPCPGQGSGWPCVPHYSTYPAAYYPPPGATYAPAQFSSGQRPGLVRLRWPGHVLSPCCHVPGPGGASAAAQGVHQARASLASPREGTSISQPAAAHLPHGPGIQRGASGRNAHSPLLLLDQALPPL